MVDKFRRLPLRFERISDVHYAFNTLAYTMITIVSLDGVYDCIDGERKPWPTDRAPG